MARLSLIIRLPFPYTSSSAYTGTKTAGRSEHEKLLKQVQGGDIIVFYSVIRMNRNAAEGIELYMTL
ncbi:MAG: hypothetical protein E7494_00825 [Ruminococcus albus]|nr:hypothetical protein [Ruminococcus albus]